MNRYLCGLIVLIFLGCETTTSRNATPVAVWATWVPRKFAEGPVQAHEFFSYLQDVMKKAHTNVDYKIYIDMEIIKCDQFAYRRPDKVLTDDSGNMEPPELPGLDLPPLLDLRSALKLYCDVLGANWRQDGSAIYITKALKESP